MLSEPLSNDREKDAKEVIVETALTMFAKRGYHKTSVNSICKKAEVSNGLIFYHFQSKEGLLKVVVETVLLKLDEIISSGKNIETPQKRLEFIIDKFAESLQIDKNIWALYMAIIYQPDTKEIIFNEVNESAKNFRRTIYELLEQMGYEDPAKSSLDFETFRVGIFSTYLYTGRQEHLVNTIQQLKDRFLKF
ncbi:MAG: TetR/AcrR family transcriptional regulator [Saprospiraceae bacterium]|jgi:AcrR family transcriptional regulator|nr:TetR/AcrR family transcriptional regulator [Saprospiraceae bacterium]MBL0024301.1 TetR/AcrR family transcriptional regulator [Saprospiraceae bacterium]